ncbi:MAG: sucrase ferredoxin [Acidimicrobiales bacterium]
MTTSPADDTFRCSPWTQAQGVDPIGSATPFDALLLVEWPLPWPRDVSDIEALAPAAADGRARVMTVVPRPDQGEADGLVRVVHHRRTGTHHLTGVDHRVPHDEVPALLLRLLDAVGDDTSEWPTAVGPAPPEVLVCAHGRRDPCCGRWGTLLHVDLTARWSDVRVWRCSHTGGHRFAPTAITLPDGRSWAYVEPDLLDGVVRRTADLGVLRAHDRGSSALDAWAQPVERAVFELVGWPWLQHQVTAVEVAVASDQQSAVVDLAWMTPDGTPGSAIGQVEVTRMVPVLLCGQPPEAAEKASPELALRHLQMADE